MTKKVYQLETIGCPSCIVKIEGALKKLEGIHQSEVLFNSSRVKVEYDDTRITSNEIKHCFSLIHLTNTPSHAYGS